MFCHNLAYAKKSFIVTRYRNLQGLPGFEHAIVKVGLNIIVNILHTTVNPKRHKLIGLT
jgi:hypothetical protein